MAIFKQNLPLPPAEGALRAEGDWSFVSKTLGWIPLGYRLDMVLDRVVNKYFLNNSISYVILDTVDTIKEAL